MNKHGFTLIEILATITIITIIASIASFNIIKIFEKKEQTNEENTNNMITSAACVYIELKKNESLKEECFSKGCEIKTDALIKEGILKDNINKNITVKITKENNEKKCAIKEE